MSRLPVQNSFLQQDPFKSGFQAPQTGGGLQSFPVLNRFQTPPPGNGFQPHPTGGNRFQPPPNGGNGFQPHPTGGIGFQPSPTSENRFQTPPPGSSFKPPPPGGNCFQPPPPGSSFQSPPPGSNFYPPPPGGNSFQPPPPGGNSFQPPPPGGNSFQPPPHGGNCFQIPPPGGNRFQPPPPANRYQPPPDCRFPPPIAVNMLLPPPSRNMLGQPPPSNVLRQPPPKNMLQQPSSSYMLQQAPPRNMFEHSPPCIFQPPPKLLPRPSLTSTLSQPPFHPTSSVSPQPSTEPETLSAVAAAQNAPGVDSLERFPSGPPSLAAACEDTHSGRPVPIRSGDHLPLSAIDRRVPPPVHRKHDLDSGAIVQSPADLVSSSSLRPPASLWNLESKSFPGGKLSCKSSSYLHSSSSVRLPGHSVESKSSPNTISKTPLPLGDTASFSIPPPLVPGGMSCFVSVDAYSRVPPPNMLFRAALSMGSIDTQSPDITNNSSSAPLLAIPRHPLNISCVSTTKLQCEVDEWVSNKLKIRETTKIPIHSDDTPNRRGQWDNSLEAKSSGMSDQGPDDLEKILEESGIQGSKRNLLSSQLPLLSRPYRDFRLQDVHRCVAAYRTLLEELRSRSDDDQRAKIKVLLDPIKCLLSDQKFQDLVKKLVRARTKKRQRKKNRKVALKQEWDSKAKLIDARREELHRLEQQKLQEVRLRSEVDGVLKEVRGKQEEAASLQSLLWTLRDLRQHRLNRGEQQGYVSSQRDDDCFSRVTDGLEKMVETQLSDYALEERTLQAMLQSSHPPAASVEHSGTQNQAPHSDISAPAVEELLFGVRSAVDEALYASYCAADTSLEMLVARRRAWDQHIVSNTTADNSSATSPEGGSGVPLCWVLPPARPTRPWRQYLAS